MNDKFRRIKKKLESPRVRRVAAYSTGAVVGSAVTILYIRRNPRTLILPREAYNALIHDETNFVRFVSKKSPQHVLRVIYEQ